MSKLKTVAVASALLVTAIAAQASSVFQGRDANGAVDSTCAATGPGACAMFYDTDLNITILNNWNVGTGTWSATAAAGSAQALAESAGFTVSGLTGWVLPTASVILSGGPSNQFTSIWDDVGQSLTGLQAQFNGVQTTKSYWSSAESSPGYSALSFDPTSGGYFLIQESIRSVCVLAVRPGDVAAVPEPSSFALMLAGIGPLAIFARRRRMAQSKPILAN